MSKFILGCLIAVLLMLAYPNWKGLLCTAVTQLDVCKAPAPEKVLTQVHETNPLLEEDITSEKEGESKEVVEEIKAPPKIYKWIDEDGVVHYGEEAAEDSQRIDEALDEITVIGGGEEAKQSNLNAARSIDVPKRSYNKNYNRSTYNQEKKKRKKSKCARIAAKRDRYPMSSQKYKAYSTWYAQECIL